MVLFATSCTMTSGRTDFAGTVLAGTVLAGTVLAGAVLAGAGAAVVSGARVGAGTVGTGAWAPARTGEAGSEPPHAETSMATAAAPSTARGMRIKRKLRQATPEGSAPGPKFTGS